MSDVQNPPEYRPPNLPVVPKPGHFDTHQATPEDPAILKDNVATTDPRLGRIPQFDPRSRDFPMKAALDDLPKRYRERSYTWGLDAHLNQGSEPSCVGFAWAHELLARPAVVDISHDFASWVYRTAQRYDAWSGEAYAGTSVLAGAKVIQKQPPAMSEGRGLIGEYRWIFGDLDDLIKTLGYFGPVIFGTWWYEGMFDPDADGFIRPTGYQAGGHAYLIRGIDVKARKLRVHNSWGQDWGMGGDAWLSFDDALRLLHEDGECCVPVRRQRLEGD